MIAHGSLLVFYTIFNTLSIYKHYNSFCFNCKSQNNFLLVLLYSHQWNEAFNKIILKELENIKIIVSVRNITRQDEKDNFESWLIS